jgi:hypothetical protein
MRLHLTTMRVTVKITAGIMLLAGSLGTSTLMGQIPPDNGSQGTPTNGPYRGYATDYPAPEVQAIPMAFAHVVTARAEQDLLQADLHSTVDRLREDFNYSPAMLAATKEQNQAVDAYDQARRNVLEKLSQDPTYRAMISLVVTLKQQLDTEHPGPKATDAQLERIVATATLKLSYASAASAMEVAALSADADIMQTRARLLEAANKVSTMRTDFERDIHRNPDFIAARRNLDEARIARLTAEAFLSGAIDARGVALDYAYYLHRFDQNAYGPSAIGYAPYPFIYGYGNGVYETGVYGNGVYGNSSGEISFGQPSSNRYR